MDEKRRFEVASALERIRPTFPPSSSPSLLLAFTIHILRFLTFANPFRPSSPSHSISHPPESRPLPPGPIALKPTIQASFLSSFLRPFSHASSTSTYPLGLRQLLRSAEGEFAIRFRACRKLGAVGRDKKRRGGSDVELNIHPVVRAHFPFAHFASTPSFDLSESRGCLPGSYCSIEGQSCIVSHKQSALSLSLSLLPSEILRVFWLSFIDC